MLSSFVGISSGSALLTSFVVAAINDSDETFEVTFFRAGPKRTVSTMPAAESITKRGIKRRRACGDILLLLFFSDLREDGRLASYLVQGLHGFFDIRYQYRKLIGRN